MRTTLLFCLLAVSLLTAAQETATEARLISGNSFTGIIPQNRFSNQFDHGFGVYANIDYKITPTFSGRFDLGWNDISGPAPVTSGSNTSINTNNISIWEFSLGVKAQFSVFYLETRGGFFTSVHEWGLIPAIGLRYKKFDLQTNYVWIENTEWLGIRLGYYWGQ